MVRKFERKSCVGSVVNKNAFFDLIEDKTVSVSIGVIDGGQKAGLAGRTGDQKGANGVFGAELGDQPELPESESFFVLAFGAPEKDRGALFK